jgi:hypothetical protein
MEFSASRILAAKVYSNLSPNVEDTFMESTACANIKDLWETWPRFIKLVYVDCSASISAIKRLKINLK